jgi:hypothetical protein
MYVCMRGDKGAKDIQNISSYKRVRVEREEGIWQVLRIGRQDWYPSPRPVSLLSVVMRTDPCLISARCLLLLNRISSLFHLSYVPLSYVPLCYCALVPLC